MNSARSVSAKLSHNGDTKRVKLTGAFEQLLDTTRTSFDKNMPSDPKFFYIDEENDLISVSSQADLDEALTSAASGSVVRLAVATTAQEAHEEFVKKATMTFPASLARTESDWEIVKDDAAPEEAVSMIDTKEQDGMSISAFDEAANPEEEESKGPSEPAPPTEMIPLDVAKHLSETEQLKIAQEQNGLSETERMLIEEALSMSRDQRLTDHVQFASINEEVD